MGRFGADLALLNSKQFLSAGFSRGAIFHNTGSQAEGVTRLPLILLFMLYLCGVYVF